MPIDLEYLRYCRAGQPFYAPAGEATSSVRLDDELRSPEGWVVRRESPWTMWWRTEAPVPRQGWKVRLSATRANCRHILKQAASYCVAEGIAFKYLSTESDFDAQNSKYADRSSAGKFVTIYPVDVSQFQSTLETLGQLFAGEPGPFVLSDRRWGNAPENGQDPSATDDV